MKKLITLTTDFGQGSGYVAAMKGVLYGVNCNINLVDLTHKIPPQDLTYTSYFLRATIPFYPPGTLHVIVVDPGVGSQRSVLYVEMEKQQLLVPDNGCWTGLVEESAPRRVLRLTEAKYWRDEISSTFHGRDIFAPVAGHLSLGVDPKELGADVESWVNLDLPRAKFSEKQIDGEVVFIDDFGNLLSNIPGEMLRRWSDKPLQISVGEQDIHTRVQSYSQTPKGVPCALVSSMSTLEIAVNHGNAAEQLNAGVGTPVCLCINDG